MDHCGKRNLSDEEINRVTNEITDSFIEYLNTIHQSPSKENQKAIRDEIKKNILTFNESVSVEDLIAREQA